MLAKSLPYDGLPEPDALAQLATVVYLVLLKITLVYCCMQIYCHVQIIAIYSKCVCLYKGVCTLADYIHDASW